VLAKVKTSSWFSFWKEMAENDAYMSSQFLGQALTCVHAGWSAHSGDLWNPVDEIEAPSASPSGRVKTKKQEVEEARARIAQMKGKTQNIFHATTRSLRLRFEGLGGLSSL
jgi:hypothetical protein